MRFINDKLYFVGDSAYALRPYLMAPFDNAEPNTKEDAFNFFLSSNRITVECAFGEISRRWGILWKPLEGSLSRKVNVIDATLKLHNICVEYRLKNNTEFTETEKLELQVASEDYSVETATLVRGLHAHDEQLQRTIGRPTNDEKSLRTWGAIRRAELANKLWSDGFRRP